MSDPPKHQRRIRKEIHGDGVDVNLAADVNIVATRGGSASEVQRTSIVQRGKRPARVRKQRQEKENDDG